MEEAPEKLDPVEKGKKSLSQVIQETQKEEAVKDGRAREEKTDATIHFPKDAED